MSRRQNGDEQMNTTTTAIIRMSHTMYNFPFHSTAESIHCHRRRHRRCRCRCSISLFFRFFILFSFSSDSTSVYLGFAIQTVFEIICTLNNKARGLAWTEWAQSVCVYGTAKHFHSKWNALPWNNFSILCKILKINDDASKWRSQISFNYLFNESIYTLPTPLSSHC